MNDFLKVIAASINGTARQHSDSTSVAALFEDHEVMLQRLVGLAAP